MPDRLFKAKLGGNLPLYSRNLSDCENTHEINQEKKMRELMKDEIALVSGGSETCATTCSQTSTGVVCVTLCWPSPPNEN